MLNSDSRNYNMKRKEDGHYEYGRVPNDKRKHGEYGVIKGKVLNNHGHSEFKGFIGLMKSPWFVYRIYDSSKSHSCVCPTTELLEYFDTKKEAKKYLDRKIGGKIE